MCNVVLLAHGVLLVVCFFFSFLVVRLLGL